MSPSNSPTTSEDEIRRDLWGPVLCAAAMATVDTSVVASKTCWEPFRALRRYRLASPAGVAPTGVAVLGVSTCLDSTEPASCLLPAAPGRIGHRILALVWRSTLRQSHSGRGIQCLDAYGRSNRCRSGSGRRSDSPSARRACPGVGGRVGGLHQPTQACVIFRKRTAWLMKNRTLVTVGKLKACGVALQSLIQRAGVQLK